MKSGSLFSMVMIMGAGAGGAYLADLFFDEPVAGAVIVMGYLIVSIIQTAGEVQAGILDEFLQEFLAGRK